MTLAHLSRLACENKLRIKKEPLKIEASGYKIHHPVNGYVFKIALTPHDLHKLDLNQYYKVTIEEVE